MSSDVPAGDVLAQPTRAKLFARLTNLNRPATTDELAGELGLHPSGVRVHLDRLRAAGLLERERSPQLRGRPRDSWRIAPDALPGASPPDAYRRLAGWLAKSIPATPTRLREVERAGREFGRELVGEPAAAGAEEAIGRTLTGLGFAPQREPGEAGGMRYRVGTCPYRDAVRDNQPVVCALHRGLTLGLLSELAPGARLAGFVPMDPDRAGCLIDVRDLPDASAATGR